MPKFDKFKLAELLNKAKGDRSINQYALQSGVTSAHISRLLRALLDTPPTPQTLRKLTDVAHNCVNYDDLMAAAGYLERTLPDQVGVSDQVIITKQGPEETEALAFLKRTHPDIIEQLEKVSELPPDQQEFIAEHWKWALEFAQKMGKISKDEPVTAKTIKEDKTSNHDIEHLVPGDEKDIGDALLKVAEISGKSGLNDEEIMELGLKTIDKYPKPEPVEGDRIAAHGPKRPGQIGRGKKEDNDE